MSHQHSQRATIALRKLAEFDPVCASLSLWADHRDTDGMAVDGVSVDAEGNVERFREMVKLAPAYTDGETVYYGTKFATWSLDEQMAVCAHEIMHIGFRHVPRGKRLYERLGDKYDSKVFNIATDAIINETLRLAGYTLPGNCVYLTELFEQVFGERIDARDAIGEWDAEKLYMKIMKESPAQQSGQGQSQDGNGQGQSGQGQSGQGQAQKSGSQGSGDSQDDEGSGDKSAAQKAKDYAEGKDFHGDMDTRGPVKPEDAQKDAEWQQRVARAMSQPSAKTAGTGIGQLGHKIADMPQARTPWEVILRRAVKKAVTRTPRPSLMRPSRNWLGSQEDARMRGAPMPPYEGGYVKQNNHPRVAVCIDVSGSIGDVELSIFCAELASIGKKTGSELHVIIFDHGVHSVQKLDGVDFENEVKKIEFARGGGTSFVEPIKAAKDLDPSIIVVLTDLYGPFGDDPRIPVIWSSTEDSPPTPPFGKLIKLTS